MKRKCVFSVVVAITLAALSAVAFVSSLVGISADEIADCWAALEMVMQDEWDESRGALYFESESASTAQR